MAHTFCIYLVIKKLESLVSFFLPPRPPNESDLFSTHWRMLSPRRIASLSSTNKNFSLSQTHTPLCAKFQKTRHFSQGPLFFVGFSEILCVQILPCLYSVWLASYCVSGKCQWSIQEQDVLGKRMECFTTLGQEEKGASLQSARLAPEGRFGQSARKSPSVCLVSPVINVTFKGEQQLC